MATKFGRYDLLERISAGGMAEVFKASIAGAAGVEKIVAIKRILPQFCDDDRFVGMFIEEARISANLNHTNIGQVYEFGEIDGRYFIAMEYIPGKDLASLQEHFAAADRVMPLPMALRIVLDICAGLHHAHTKVDTAGQTFRIVHRDVSPPNVLVSYEGAVKLIDFGIAKAMARSSKTATGLLKGKYGYLSPEQAEGKEIDHRSDLFSLGTVLHELVTGQRLFVGDSDMATLMAVRSAPVLLPSEVNSGLPEELDHVVMTALERERDHRYQRALDFYVALESLVNQAGLHFGTVHLGTWMADTFSYGKPAPVAGQAPRPMASGFKHIISLQPEPALVTGVRPRPTPPAEEPPEKRDLKIDTFREIARDQRRITPHPSTEEPGETRVTSESAALAAMLARNASRPAFEEDSEASITTQQNPSADESVSEETRGRGIALPRDRPTSDAQRRAASTEPAARRLTPTSEARRQLTPTNEPRRRLTPTSEQRQRLTPASGPHRLPSQPRRAVSVPQPILDDPPPIPEEEPSLDSAAITLKPGLLWAKPTSGALQHSPTATGVGRDPTPDAAELEPPTGVRLGSPSEDYAELEVDARSKAAEPSLEEILDQTVPAPERTLPAPPEVPSFDALAAEDGSNWDDVTSDLANPAMADRLATVEEAIRVARAEAQAAHRELPDLDATTRMPALDDATAEMPALDDATAQMPALDDATAQMPALPDDHGPFGPGTFDDLPTHLHTPGPEPGSPASVPEVVIPISPAFVPSEDEPGWDSIRTRGAPADVNRAEAKTPEELPAFAVEDLVAAPLAESDASDDAVVTAPRPAQLYQADQHSDEIPMPGHRSGPAAIKGDAEEFGDEPTRIDPPGSAPGLEESLPAGAQAVAPEEVQLIHPQDLEGDLQPAPPQKRRRRRAILLLLAILLVLGAAGVLLAVLIGGDSIGMHSLRELAPKAPSPERGTPKPPANRAK